MKININGKWKTVEGVKIINNSKIIELNDIQDIRLVDDENPIDKAMGVGCKNDCEACKPSTKIEELEYCDEVDELSATFITVAENRFLIKELECKINEIIKVINKERQ